MDEGEAALGRGGDGAGGVPQVGSQEPGAAGASAGPGGASAEPFFDLSLDLLCIAGLDQRFLRLNPAFQQVLGYTEEELRARLFTEFVHPEDRDATLAALEALAKGNRVVHFENRYRCKNGEYRWLSWSASPLVERGLIYAWARDVTETKLAGVRLRSREQLLREAQEIAGIAVWEWELTGDSTDGADALEALLSKSSSGEAADDGYWSRVHAQDRAALEGAVRGALSSRGSFDLEHRLMLPNGEIRYVRAQGRVSQERSGQGARLVGTVHDVTERRRAELDAQLIARVTQAISSADGLDRSLSVALCEIAEAEGWDYGEIWFPRPDGTALDCSRASYTRSQSLREFRERSQARVCERDVTLPGRVFANARWEWHEDLSTVSDDVFCRAELARQSGLRCCVGIPLVADHEVVAVLVLLRAQAARQNLRDVAVLQTATAQLGGLIRRRQAEEQLRATEERLYLASRATRDVIYDWVLDSDELWLSEVLERSFGYAARTAPLAWWANLIHPEDAAAIGASLTAALDGGESFWAGEYRFLHADGHYAHVFDRGYISRDASGKAVRMIGSMMDISERTRAAQELKQAKEAAEQGARAKSEFLANMSHEIRTPLTAVLGFADMLLDPRLSDSERLNYAMTIRRNGEHLLQLLNDILDLSKIEAGKLNVEAIDCSPAQIITEVASLMRVRAKEKGLDFDVKYATPLPSKLQTDPTRLRQILLNLVSNAVKFTERGKVEINARFEPGAGAEEPRLVLAVSDTGIGIAPEQLQTLFQPFSQADRSMTRKYGGTGLGLAICAPIAAALGGELQVESMPGRGSTFSVSVPTKADPELEPSQSEALGPGLGGPLPPTESTLLSGNVLLAEDGADNQVLISTVLRKRGLDVTVVENGRLAVDRALLAWRAGRPFDLVLMDMQMPELDGYGATAQLRAKGYQGAIVALTAHAMAGERERCLAAGCDDYLTKPIDRTRLVTAVRGYVQQARSNPPRAAELVAVDRAPAARTGERLVSTYEDDPEMAEIVSSFVGGLSSRMAAMREALQQDDLPALQRSAHQLRGAAGGYGFPLITEAAAVLETSCRSGAARPQLRAELELLVQLCERARLPAGEPAVISSSGQGSVVTIDDSPEIHQLVEARLRGDGLTMFRAMDAGEGLAMVRRERPDLVLLDLDLPGQDGFAVCRQLKAHPDTASIPVLFLTGTSDAVMKAAAFDLGAVDYVTKPFDAVELRARVRAALRTKRYQDLLATRAQLDGLTGLWNRTYFDTRLSEELAAAQRHRRALALALIDIDHFKHVNDDYGHPIGDLVLQRVATTLIHSARSSDTVCRFGGEEFAVVLRETPAEGAAVVAERMRSAIAALTFDVKGKTIRVSASFGVAEAQPTGAGGAPPAHALVGAADAALYSAKRGGRNQVVVAPLVGTI